VLPSSSRGAYRRFGETGINASVFRVEAVVWIRSHISIVIRFNMPICGLGNVGSRLSETSVERTKLHYVTFQIAVMLIKKNKRNPAKRKTWINFEMEECCLDGRQCFCCLKETHEYKIPPYGTYGKCAILLLGIFHNHRISLILPSSGLLRGVSWFKTDVSGLPISPIFKGQAARKAVQGSNIGTAVLKFPF
jgi:hypothetical protein